jgi:non-homologous end joining protein Ku
MRAKERGETVSVAEEEDDSDAPVDLMAALRESVEAARKARGTPPKRRRRRKAA